MSYSRLFIGFAAGCGAMYVVSSHLAAEKPDVIASSITTAVEGPSVAIGSVSVPQAAALRAKEKTESGNLITPVTVAHVEVPVAPEDAEILAQLNRLGLPEAKAHELLSKFGPVKVNALIERELQGRKAAPQPPEVLHSADAESPSAGSDAPQETSDTASQMRAALAAAVSGLDTPQADPYPQVKETREAMRSSQSDEDLQAERQQRFRDYVDTVHASEKEVLQDNEEGQTCSAVKCLK